MGPITESFEQLALALERYRGLLNSGQHAVAVLDAVNDGEDFIFRDLSQTEVIEGITRDQAIGRRLSDLQPALEQPGLLDVLRRVWRSGELERRPLLRHQGGHIDSWRENIIFRLPGGALAIVSEDATERRRNEQQLLNAAETLQAVMDGVPSYVYVADMETYEVLFMNRLARERFGDVVGHICWEALQENQSGPCPFCSNAKLLDEDGNPIGLHVWDYHDRIAGRWLECRDQAIPWNNGQLVRMQIATDITQRKQMEEKLQLAARALETSEGILITDTEGTIVKVNDAFTRITGYSPDEAIGRNPRILKSDLNDPTLYAHMWEALTGAGSWSGEIWNRRKDGSTYPEWLNITAVRDDDWQVTHYVAHFQDISERKRFEARIAYQALYDDLTDLPNRRLLLDRLRQRLAEAGRHHTLGGVLFLDLDNFKSINDRLGHAVGDAILQQAGLRIARSVRQEDTAARFGGDEFVILLFRLGEREPEARSHALRIADKIRRTLIDPMVVEGRRLSVSTSIGATLFPNRGADADTLIRWADEAMYAAKKAGKNRISFFGNA